MTCEAANAVTGNGDIAMSPPTVDDNGDDRQSARWYVHPTLYSVELTRLEILSALRVLRSARLELDEYLRTLEERGHNDAVSQGAMLTLAAQADLLGGIIRKLWKPIVGVQDPQPLPYGDSPYKTTD